MKIFKKLKNLSNNTQYMITMLVMVVLFWAFALWVKSW